MRVIININRYFRITLNLVILKKKLKHANISFVSNSWYEKFTCVGQTILNLKGYYYKNPYRAFSNKLPSTRISSSWYNAIPFLKAGSFDNGIRNFWRAAKSCNTSNFTVPEKKRSLNRLVIFYGKRNQ